MKEKMSIVKILLLTVLISNSVIAYEPSRETSVCTIVALHPTKGGMGLGSGFIFQDKDDEYRIMTAKHVIMNHPNFTHVAMFHHPTWESYILDIKTYAANKDVGILSFKKGKTIRHVWDIDVNYKLTRGEKLFLMSITPDDGLNLKYCRFSHIIPGDAHEFKIMGSGAKGNSGGPVINKDKKVVGILNKINGVGGMVAVKAPSVKPRVAVELKPDTDFSLPAFPLHDVKSGN